MFKVGDKVVWNGLFDEGAVCVITQMYSDMSDDGFYTIKFLTGSRAGNSITVQFKYCGHLSLYNDPETPSFASRADDFLDAMLNVGDFLKQNQNYNCAVKVVEIPEKNTSPKNKYDREIVPGVWIDVYDLLAAWKVTNPALQHLIKKALQAGDRGHKDLETDLQDIVDSALRAKQLEGF